LLVGSLTIRFLISRPFLHGADLEVMVKSSFAARFGSLFSLSLHVRHAADAKGIETGILTGSMTIAG